MQDEIDIKFGGRIKRAQLIDKLFGIASMPQMNMVDKSIVF